MTDNIKQKAEQRFLILKRVGIDTYRENVVYMHRDCELYRAEGFQALSKIEITENGNKILAVLNVVDDKSIVAPGELGLSEQAFDQLKVKEMSQVKVQHAEPPHSMDAVRRKLAGERLSEQEFMDIAHDIAESRYSKTEMTAFLVSAGQSGFDRDEVLYLTRAMVSTGDKLEWHESLVADKHCIGGIPGNRTSMLLVPIVASHGMLIPKTSSRAITSPAGTADTMEVFACVELNLQEMRSVVQANRACIVWGGTARLAPVDDMLISVERPLAIDSVGQMVASILSKKIAAGSTHLIIDIPVGPTAKVRQMNQAMHLRKIFEYVGDQLGLHLEVVITDGRQPIGRGIGPVLEARDVMQVLQNDPQAPHDLLEKSLQLAGRILEFDPDVRGGQGYNIARDILESGRALETFNKIIQQQGAQEHEYKLGNLTYDVSALSSGVVSEINNLQLAKIASRAGAPMDKGAGVDLFKKLGDSVEQGESLYRVYAEFESDYRFACELSSRNNGYTID